MPAVATTSDRLDSAEGKRQFRLVSNHELIRPCGGGGYGKVWLARSVTGAYRAIKVVFRSDFKSDTPYEREYKGILKFEPISRDHDGFVDILHVGRNDEEGYFYYVMEAGDDEKSGQLIRPEDYHPKTLDSERKQRGALPLEECLGLAMKLTLALGALHRAGLVHRDIKPANTIFVNGVPKLADIGLVTDAGSEVSFVGTEGYIAPEGPGAPTADIFSLGKVLYEISTGNDRLQFPELPDHVLQGNGASGPFLEFNEILLKACEVKVTDRYQTAADLHAHLAFLQAGKSVRRILAVDRWLQRARRLAPVAAFLLVGIVGLIYLVLHENKRKSDDRQRQVASSVSYGTRAMESGDYFGSLPWFTEALRLEENDPYKDRTHRLRLGSVLQHCPRPVRIWFHPPTSHHLTRAEFGPDSNLVLMPNDEGRSAIYNVRTGERVSALFGNGSFRDRASFSPDFKRAIRSNYANKTEVWDFAAGTNIWSVKLPPMDYINDAKFNPAGDRIVAGCKSGEVRVWEFPSGRLLHILPVHTKSVSHVTFSPDGRRIVTAGWDGTAAVWDADSGDLLQRFTNHNTLVNYAGVRPDSRAIATASADRTARVWDAETGREMLPPLEHDDGVASVEFSPDGNWLVTACWDSTVRLWDAHTGKPIDPPLKHTGRMMHACFSPDGARILTVCYDGFVTIWEVPVTPAALEPVPAVFSENGARSATLTNGALVVRDAFSSNVLSTRHLGGPLAAEPLFDRDGDSLLTLTQTNSSEGEPVIAAEVWRACDGGAAGPPIILPAGFTNAVISASGQRLVALYGTNALCFFTQKGTQLAAWSPNTHKITVAAFDSAGERLALAAGRLVNLYDAQNGRALINEPLPHPRGMTVSHVEFSHNGRLLVTTFMNAMFDRGAAQLWDPATGEPIGQPLKHRDGVLCAAFSPDDRYLITTGEDFSALIWDVQTGQPLPIPPLRHKHQITWASFSPDGRWVLTASADHRARVWEVATGEPLTLPFEAPAPLRRAQFVAGATAIVTESYDHRHWLWPLPRETAPVKDLGLLAQFLSAQRASRTSVGFAQTDEMLWSSYLELRAKYPSQFQAK